MPQFTTRTLVDVVFAFLPPWEASAAPEVLVSSAFSILGLYLGQSYI
jgi:hypothetical protein